MLQKFWENYLSENGGNKEMKYTGVLSFGMDVRTADEAVQNVCNGTRRVNIVPENGYRCAMNGAILPQQANIVVDWKGSPRAVIETVSVDKVHFADLNDEICALEGVCGNADDWREKHMPVLKMELEELGEELTEDTVLLVEHFRTVYSI